MAFIIQHLEVWAANLLTVWVERAALCPAALKRLCPPSPVWTTGSFLRRLAGVSVDVHGAQAGLYART